MRANFTVHVSLLLTTLSVGNLQGFQCLLIQGGTKDRHIGRSDLAYVCTLKEHQLDLKRPKYLDHMRILELDVGAVANLIVRHLESTNRASLKQFLLQDPGTASCLPKSSGGPVSRSVFIAVGKPTSVFFQISRT